MVSVNSERNQTPLYTIALDERRHVQVKWLSGRRVLARLLVRSGGEGSACNSNGMETSRGLPSVDVGPRRAESDAGLRGPEAQCSDSSPKSGAVVIVVQQKLGIPNKEAMSSCVQ